MKDERADTSETCLACGEDYDNRRGGTCGGSYAKASDQKQTFCLCEHCSESAYRECVVSRESLASDVIPDTDWTNLKAWADAQKEVA